MSETYSFGEWVSGRRKALDLTQRELAERAACGVATIKKIEGDERRPSRELAGLLADALRVSSDLRDTFMECARGLRPVDALGTPETSSDAPHTAPAVSLPAQSTPFIGREAELAQIEQHLNDPACRLLTLLGAGGIGKTRLAIAVGEGLRPSPTFADGIFFVPLAGVNAPEYLLSTIAERLKFSFSSESDPKIQLFSYLRGKTLLLVLDNFEHLLDGADLLADILQNAPGVKMLVTSRERLNLQSEWLFPLIGLPFPAGEQDEGAEGFDAVRLFEGSARRATPGYDLRNELPAVVRICKMTEGMPLALELAASWTRRMPPVQIAEEIQRDLNFLAVNWRDIPERHRSIRALFEHSWQLLSAGEQDALMKLSVFRGSFDAESSEAVAGAGLPMLAALEDKSLIRSSPSGRYDLHELIRQFAESKLAEAGLKADIQNRHLDYFTTWTEMVETMQRGPELVWWAKRVQLERDNQHAAMEWAFNGGDAEKGLRLANAMWWYWFGRGHWALGLGWYETGLKQIKADLPVRAYALYHAATTAAQLRKPTARTYIMESLELAQQLELPRLIAMCYVNLNFTIPEYDLAVRRFEEAIAILRQLNDDSAQFSLCIALWMYGDRARAHGDLERAEAQYRECLEIARGDQNLVGMMAALGSLGRLLVTQGDYQQGASMVEEALNISRDIDLRLSAAECLISLGGWAMYQGDFETAERHLSESLAIWRERDSLMGILHTLYFLADLALHQEDFSGAARLLAESLHMTFQVGGWQQNYSMHEFNIERLPIVGKLACALQEYRQAARLFSTGEALHQQVGYRLEPLAQAEAEAAVTLAREQLGDAEFEAAWNEGQALSLEQAVQEALEFVRQVATKA